MTFVLKRNKQTKKNKQKYVHPFSFKPPHICNAKSHKKVSKSFPILKKTTMHRPFRSFYSMPWNQFDLMKSRSL